MSTDRTTRLSKEGTEEILEEMKSPPKDTPERRATFKRMHDLAERFEMTVGPKVFKSDD